MPFTNIYIYILQIYIAGVDYIDGGNIDSTHTDPDVKAEKGTHDEGCFDFHWG